MSRYIFDRELSDAQKMAVMQYGYSLQVKWLKSLDASPGVIDAMIEKQETLNAADAANVRDFKYKAINLAEIKVCVLKLDTAALKARINFSSFEEIKAKYVALVVSYQDSIQTQSAVASTASAVASRASVVAPSTASAVLPSRASAVASRASVVAPSTASAVASRASAVAPSTASAVANRAVPARRIFDTELSNKQMKKVMLYGYKLQIKWLTRLNASSDVIGAMEQKRKDVKVAIDTEKVRTFKQDSGLSDIKTYVDIFDGPLKNAIGECNNFDDVKARYLRLVLTYEDLQKDRERRAVPSAATSVPAPAAAADAAAADAAAADAADAARAEAEAKHNEIMKAIAANRGGGCKMCVLVLILLVFVVALTGFAVYKWKPPSYQSTQDPHAAEFAAAFPERLTIVNSPVDYLNISDSVASVLGAPDGSGLATNITSKLEWEYNQMIMIHVAVNAKMAHPTNAMLPTNWNREEFIKFESMSDPKSFKNALAVSYRSAKVYIDALSRVEDTDVKSTKKSVLNMYLVCFDSIKEYEKTLPKRNKMFAISDTTAAFVDIAAGVPQIDSGAVSTNLLGHVDSGAVSTNLLGHVDSGAVPTSLLGHVDSGAVSTNLLGPLSQKGSDGGHYWYIKDGTVYLGNRLPLSQTGADAAFPHSSYYESANGLHGLHLGPFEHVGQIGGSNLAVSGSSYYESGGSDLAVSGSSYDESGGSYLATVINAARNFGQISSSRVANVLQNIIGYNKHACVNIQFTNTFSTTDFQTSFLYWLQLKQTPINTGAQMKTLALSKAMFTAVEECTAATNEFMRLVSSGSDRSFKNIPSAITSALRLAAVELKRCAEDEGVKDFQSWLVPLQKYITTLQDNVKLLYTTPADFDLGLELQWFLDIQTTLTKGITDAALAVNDAKKALDYITKMDLLAATVENWGIDKTQKDNAIRLRFAALSALHTQAMSYEAIISMAGDQVKKLSQTVTAITMLYDSVRALESTVQAQGLATEPSLGERVKKYFSGTPSASDILVKNFLDEKASTLETEREILIHAAPSPSSMKTIQAYSKHARNIILAIYQRRKEATDQIRAPINQQFEYNDPIVKGLFSAICYEKQNPSQPPLTLLGPLHKEALRKTLNTIESAELLATHHRSKDTLLQKYITDKNAAAEASFDLSQNITMQALTTEITVQQLHVNSSGFTAQDLQDELKADPTNENIIRAAEGAFTLHEQNKIRLAALKEQLAAVKGMSSEIYTFFTSSPPMFDKSMKVEDIKALFLNFQAILMNKYADVKVIDTNKSAQKITTWVQTFVSFISPEDLASLQNELTMMMTDKHLSPQRAVTAIMFSLQAFYEAAFNGNKINEYFTHPSCVVFPGGFNVTVHALRVIEASLVAKNETYSVLPEFKFNITRTQTIKDIAIEGNNNVTMWIQEMVYRITKAHESGDTMALYPLVNCLRALAKAVIDIYVEKNPGAVASKRMLQLFYKWAPIAAGASASVAGALKTGNPVAFSLSILGSATLAYVAGDMHEAGVGVLFSDMKEFVSLIPELEWRVGWFT